MTSQAPAAPLRSDDGLLSIFLIFLRFGVLAWGGPVAQIAMIREELVDRKGWVAADKFKRALAVYQALPGPEAHELCVYFGMVRKGRWGGFLAGLGFMLPGLVLVLALSEAYVRFGAGVLLPLFAGISPAVVALIFRAVHRIGEHILTSPSLWTAGLLSVTLTLLKVHFLWVFVICGFWQSLWAKGMRHAAVASVSILIAAALLSSFILQTDMWLDLPHGNLLIEGLKAGLLSFGGAYTAIPFLNQSMVGAYPAITQQAFLDGIALSTVIPAPLIIFGTFLGHLAGGFGGALLMTLGIFAPAFSFTLLGHGYLEKLIERPGLHGVLDGIAAAVAGILAVTALAIAAGILTTPLSLALFALALGGFYVLKKIWAVPAIIGICGLLGFAANALL